MTPGRAILLITTLWLAVHGVVFQGLVPTLTDDTIHYYNMGRSLMSGTRLTEHFYQPAGYPLTVGLFSHYLSLKSLVRFQHLLVLGAGLLTWASGRLLGRPGAGLLAACWLVSYFHTAALAQTLLCETFALFLISAAIVLLLLQLRQSGPWRGVHLGLAGLALGLAGTMRPVAFGVVLLVALLVAACELARARRPSPAAVLCALLPAFPVMAAAAACYLAACAVSFHANGHFELTRSSGRHLFNRIFDTDRLENAGGPQTQKLLRITGAETLVGCSWWDIYEPCLKAGMTEAEADRLLWEASLESFSAPQTRYIIPKYAASTALNSLTLFLVPRELTTTDTSPLAKDYTVFTHEMTFSTARTQEAFLHLVNIARRFSPEWIFNLLGLAAFAGAFALFKERRRAEALLLTVPMAGYLIGCAAVEMIETRHVMAWLLPRTLLGLIGLHWLAMQWLRHAGGGMPPLVARASRPRRRPGGLRHSGAGWKARAPGCAAHEFTG